MWRSSLYGSAAWTNLPQHSVSWHLQHWIKEFTAASHLGTYLYIYRQSYKYIIYFIYVPTFAASSTPQRGWQTSGKRRILGRQSSQCNADAWIERDFGFQSDGQGREQRCQTFEASSLEAETTGRLFQESHRECSLLEKAQVELHSWLQVKVQGLHHRYKATGHDRRVLCFSALLGSASFWALPDYVTRAGQKVTAGQTGASS